MQKTSTTQRWRAREGEAELLYESDAAPCATESRNLEERQLAGQEAEKVPLSDAVQRMPWSSVLTEARGNEIHVKLKGAGSDRGMIKLLITFSQGSSYLVHLWVSHGGQRQKKYVYSYYYYDSDHDGKDVIERILESGKRQS